MSTHALRLVKMLPVRSKEKCHALCGRSVRYLSQRSMDPKQLKADQDYCVELVQSRDREGYRKSCLLVIFLLCGILFAHIVFTFYRPSVCGLLMPSCARKSYFAVRAYNVELASVKDGSERRRASGETGSSLGLRMRMQWWRDALGQLYGEPSAQEEPTPQGFLAHTAESCWHNPVVRPLYVAIEENDLTRRFLERMLDAREYDLDAQQMATIEDAKMYAEDTWSSLFYLSLECAGVREDAADVVASHAGIGTGLTMALRSTIQRASYGNEMTIPADLFPKPIPSSYMMRRNDPEYPVDLEYEEILRNAAQHMAYEASVELSKARELQADVPKAGRACLLPAVPAMSYLSRLKDANFDLWDPKLNVEQSRLSVLTMLGKSWLIGKI